MGSAPRASSQVTEVQRIAVPAIDSWQQHALTQAYSDHPEGAHVGQVRQRLSQLEIVLPLFIVSLSQTPRACLQGASTHGNEVSWVVRTSQLSR